MSSKNIILFILINYSLLFGVEYSLEHREVAHNSSAPKVSIITSLYKGDEFIAGFLSDITRQTIFNECELIIINAHSPGNEEPIIQAYMQKFPNIIYRRLTYDPGIYAVWNMAIKMARAPFITNANVDDRRKTDSLEVQAQCLNENPDVDLVYGGYYTTYTPNEQFEHNTHRFFTEPKEFKLSRMYLCLPGPQPMWRKSMHKRFGYFDESYFSAGDFEMWNRAASNGAQFKYIPQILGLFYHNPKGLSTDVTKRTLQQTEVARIRKQYQHYWIIS